MSSEMFVRVANRKSPLPPYPKEKEVPHMRNFYLHVIFFILGFISRSQPRSLRSEHSWRRSVRMMPCCLSLKGKSMEKYSGSNRHVSHTSYKTRGSRHVVQNTPVSVIWKIVVERLLPFVIRVRFPLPDANRWWFGFV